MYIRRDVDDSVKRFLYITPILRYHDTTRVANSISSDGILINTVIMWNNNNLISNDTNKEIYFGLCFDCDGVLARGSHPIPAAVDGFKLLHDQKGILQVPVCFVTNAVNRDCDKAAAVAKWLHTKVNVEQMIEAQSPLVLYEQYKNKHVLVIGQGKIHDIAKDVGFTNICTMEDVVAAYPTYDVVNHENRVRNMKCPLTPQPIPRVEAIVLMGEPSDWGRDLQLIIDLLLTNGKPDSKPEDDDVIREPIPLIACSADLLFMDQAPLPRFGHGSFLVCLEALYKKITNEPLKYTSIMGKPSEVTYRYAEHCLINEAQRIGIKNPLKRMYFIGDCPDSDILGANLYQESIDRCRERHLTQTSIESDMGAEQDIALPRSRNMPHDSTSNKLEVEDVVSILVCTGVYKPEDEKCSHGVKTSTRGHRDFPNREPLYRPTHIVQDANEAIRLVLKLESLL